MRHHALMQCFACVITINALSLLVKSNTSCGNRKQAILDPLMNTKVKATTIIVFETWNDLNCVQRCLRLERCTSVNTKINSDHSTICEALASNSDDKVVREEGWKHYNVMKGEHVCRTVEKSICSANEICVDDHSIAGGFRCDALTNIALGKPTSQSSTGWNGLSKYAVDGNRNGNYYYGSCTHTYSGSKPWWMVDFGMEKPVQAVSITNRADCCSGRLGNFSIYVGNQLRNGGEGNDVCLDHIIMTNIKRKLFRCLKIVHGRYLYISSHLSFELTLCEVEVYARPTKITKC